MGACFVRSYLEFFFSEEEGEMLKGQGGVE